MSCDDYGNRIAWFLTGAALGAAVCLLYAPQSGRDTRKYIRRRAEDGKDAVADAGKDVLDRGREYYEKGRKEAGELLARGGKLIRS